MINSKSICVVVPAYNEAKLISKTIGGIPNYIDRIVVVNDCSKDNTAKIVSEIAETDPRVVLLSHEDNKGVGGAISTGYIYCRDNDLDIAVVMAGDNQMDPCDLPALLDPILKDKADYSKGNRLITGVAWATIPRVRYIGNSMLSFLTKIASGYWHVADSQTGYTAINKYALKMLPLEEIYPRYGMPNDFLVTLNIYNMRVADVPVRPVYADETSGINIKKIIFSLSILLIKLFFKRMTQKYVIRDFHPLVLFYSFGFLLTIINIPFIIRFFYIWISTKVAPDITLIMILLLTISSLQFFLFAMLFDMEANRDLK